MPKLPKDSPNGSIKSGRKLSLTLNFHDTYLSRQLQPVILPAIIVQGQESVKIWIFSSSEKSWMKLLNSDLEALAYTYLANRSFIPAFLKLFITSGKKIRATLSYSLLTGPKSMSASMTLRGPLLIKSFGPGELKRNLQIKLEKSLKIGNLLLLDISKGPIQKKQRRKDGKE